ncbi:MAG: HAMP domain-containing protein, partial [Prevotella sp.]|nr:HAMP domain-containing protein [Prevotella sp.]
MAKSYQSFSRRLSRRLIFIVLIMMGLMVVGIVVQTLRMTEEVSEAHYQVVMETSKKSIEKELRSVEVASLNDAVEVERHLGSPEEVFETLERNLRQNTGVRAYFAAFEPGFFAGEGHWFCANVYWEGKTIVKQRIGSQQQDYLQRKWYKKGIMDKNGFWSEPYIGVSDTTLRLCSFIVPIRDQAGRPAGVFGADIDLFHLHRWLKWKDESMNKRGITKIGRESRNEKDLWSYSFIVSREGEFFSHPDSSRILNDNLFPQFGTQPDTVGQRMIRDMKAGKPGIAKTKVDGTTVKIFYAPLEHTDWMVGVVVPQWVQLSIGVHMSLVLGAIVLIGLLLIYLVSRLTIHRTVRPLHAFAQSAEEVSRGNFSSPLPDDKSIDELRILHDAFGVMQTSLTAYVEEVKSTTAEKAVFEREMSTAALIQMHMIPNQFPPYPER